MRHKRGLAIYLLPLAIMLVGMGIVAISFDETSATGFSVFDVNTQNQFSASAEINCVNKTYDKFAYVVAEIPPGDIVPMTLIGEITVIECDDGIIVGPNFFEEVLFGRAQIPEFLADYGYYESDFFAGMLEVAQGELEGDQYVFETLAFLVLGGGAFETFEDPFTMIGQFNGSLNNTCLKGINASEEPILFQGPDGFLNITVHDYWNCFVEDIEGLDEFNPRDLFPEETFDPPSFYDFDSIVSLHLVDQGNDLLITTNGNVQVQTFNPVDGDPNFVPTEMLAMDLVGDHPILGNVQIDAGPGNPGQLTQNEFDTDFPADSFFDISFDLTFQGETLRPAAPIRIEADLFEMPWVGECHLFRGAIDMLDEQNLTSMTLEQFLWCPFAVNLTISDTDEDGIVDVIDNCPEDANPGQENEDGDEFGDACDPCLADTINDPDGDEICGLEDSCPFDFGEDDDGDGICGDDNCPSFACPTKTQVGACEDVENALECGESWQVYDSEYGRQVLSCFLASGEGGPECSPCTYEDQVAGNCGNSCAIADCTGRTSLVKKCTQIHDQNSCGQSYMVGPEGLISCYFGLGDDDDPGDDPGCRACGPNNEGEFCQNQCLAANADQLDSDLDFVGNICDLCPGSDDNLDADQDGIPDGCDVCPGGDDKKDLDGDGIPDACDNCASGACPQNQHFVYNCEDIALEEMCDSSWMLSEGGITSCYFGSDELIEIGSEIDSCHECTPERKAADLCNNECVANCQPREIIVSDCQGIVDANLCGEAFQFGEYGALESCFFGANYNGDNGCHACDERNGHLCTNICTVSQGASQTDTDEDNIGDICDVCPDDPENTCLLNVLPYTKEGPNVEDGIFNEEEWEGAEVLTIRAGELQIQTPGQGVVYVYELFDNDYVYLAVDMPFDLTDSIGDFFTAEFDVDNNEDFICFPDRSYTLDGAGNLNSVCGDAEHIGAPGFGATPNNAADHRFFEMAIPVEQLFNPLTNEYESPIGKVFAGADNDSQTDWIYPNDAELGSEEGDALFFQDMVFDNTQTLIEFWSENIIGTINDIEIVDVNGDGVNDVVVVDEGGPFTVRAYEGETGTELWSTPINGKVLSSGEFTVEYGVRGGDPYTGILVGDSQGAVHILKASTGDVAFTHVVGCPISDIEGADINGDGVDELVYSDTCDLDTIEALDGTTGFGIGRFISPANEIASGDLNGDGLADIGGVEDYTVALASDLGGDFDQIFLDEDGEGFAIDINDIDGDGDADVLSSSGNTLKLFANDNGTPEELVFGAPIEDVIIGDGMAAAITSAPVTIFFVDNELNVFHEGKHSAPFGLIAASPGPGFFEQNFLGVGEDFLAAITDDNRLYVYGQDGSSVAYKNLNGFGRVVKVGLLREGIPIIVTASQDEGSTLKVWRFADIRGEVLGFEINERPSDNGVTVEVKDNQGNARVAIEVPVGETLDFTNAVVVNQVGLAAVNGLDLPEGVRKSLTMDVAAGTTQVCVLDQPNAAAISATCNGGGEFILPCPGVIGPYECVNNGNSVTVSGLENSAIGTFGGAARGGGGGGGGGGGSFLSYCEPVWSCTDYAACENNKQKRTCIDTQHCNTDLGKPSEERFCAMPRAEPTAEPQVSEPDPVIIPKVEALKEEAEKVIETPKEAPINILAYIGLLVIIIGAIVGGFIYYQQRKEEPQELPAAPAPVENKKAKKSKKKK